MLPIFINEVQIPHKPGIYMYKNSSGKVIYVGKAIDLHNRVSSYFSGKPHDLKTTQLVINVAAIETIIVESEIEALILEANLIKKYLPLYNIKLTDDKDYLYIGITREDFPKVVTARKPELKTLKKYFGPFPSSTTVKKTLKQLRRIFPWCSGKNQKAVILGSSDFTRIQKNPDPGQARMTRHRACFYYHINLCPGACVGAISKEDYQKIITRFSKFMDGKKDELLDDLTKEMATLSKDLNFEEARRVKKIVTGIQYLTSPTRITQYLENPNFLEDVTKQSLFDLQRDLNLPELPERIECYDISNIQGTDATGSMVVLTNGEIDKSQYRRFKIKISGKPNDYAMHAEMMGRRLNHPEWGIPQLIIIDGGRGQVTAVQAVILNVVKDLSRMRGTSNKLRDSSALPQNDIWSNIPIFGLAKREEWLYPPEGEIIKLPKRSLSLRLLQRIRNESHRFAINYHRKLRSKSFLTK